MSFTDAGSRCTPRHDVGADTIIRQHGAQNPGLTMVEGPHGIESA